MAVHRQRPAEIHQNWTISSANGPSNVVGEGTLHTERRIILRRILDDSLPRLIIGDQRLTRTAKLVYLSLRHLPKNTIAQNAAALNMPYETVRGAVQQLIETGWAYRCRQSSTGRVIVVTWMPKDVERDLARQVELRSGLVANKGEWTMKAYLDLYVDDRDYEDNARPQWAVSGDGSGRSEIDRWYKGARVAIEFQGRQHYEIVTFSDGRSSNLEAQRMRDGLKALLCLRQGITFVEIPATELSYETIVGKLEGHLPLIPPLVDRPLFQCLQNLSHSYVNAARQGKRA